MDFGLAPRSDLMGTLASHYFASLTSIDKAVIFIAVYLSDPGVPGVRSMGLDLCPSLTTRLCADLTDVTLADDDCNSIPTDDVNRAF